jgi:type VI secretion system VasD/TssJ family lipoprotein
MRAAQILSLLAAFLVVIGCSSILEPFLSYDPTKPVTLTVTTPFDLNTYGEDNEAHSVYLYFFKVENQVTFNSADAAELKSGERLAGVEAASPVKKVVRPGQTETIVIEPLGVERFTHLGVIAGFRQGNVKSVAKVPWGTELRLSLGAHEIISFQR